MEIWQILDMWREEYVNTSYSQIIALFLEIVNRMAMSEFWPEVIAIIVQAQ